jgi:hypothetical protein
VVGVALCRDDGVPPVLGEVLPLVDDGLVKPFGFGQRLGERHHLYREELLPVRTVIVRTRPNAPADAQVVERAHVGGSLAAPQRADPPDQELGEAP